MSWAFVGEFVEGLTSEQVVAGSNLILKANPIRHSLNYRIVTTVVHYIEVLGIAIIAPSCDVYVYCMFQLCAVQAVE